MKTQLENIKNLENNGLLSKSLIYIEFKPFIMEKLKKGYSVKAVLKEINDKLEEAGIGMKLTISSFYYWANKVNKFTGKKNLTKEEIQNAVETTSKTTSKTKTGIFDNLKKISE